jgi:hypothetical protein
MLTPTQTAIVKADILANSDMNAVAANTDGSYVIKDLYNALASPDFLVWRTDVPVQDIFNAVDWTKYTPTDVPRIDDTPAQAVLYQNRNAIMYRAATVAEKLLTTGAGTTGTPSLLVFEGTVTVGEVDHMLWNDSGTKLI